MVKERIAEIDTTIGMAIQNVRQQALLKNVAIGDLYLKKYKSEKQDITFEDLVKIPLLKKMPLPSVKGGVIMTTNITKNTNGERLYFEVCWTSGATLVMHEHSNAEERIKVRKGLFSLITVNELGEEERFTLRSGDVVHIGHGELHQITALEKGRMEIKFTRTNG